LWVFPCNGPVDPGITQQSVSEAISRVSADYDRVILDCPPSLAGVATAALLASDDVLIPIQAEYYALEGLGQILGLVASLRDEGLSHEVRLRILLCMYDAELRLNRDVVTEVRQHLGDQALTTVIPRDVALAAAPSHRHTIIEHQPLSPGSLAYCAAAKELFHV
jgi:chromosome partitioning protein